MANPPQVFVGGDNSAREGISPDKLEQKRRFSLNSIIDSLPKLCKDEFRNCDLDETISVSSQFSTENGLNSIHPALVEEEAKPIKEKKEKVPSPTGMMQSRTTTKRRNGVSRSPRVREHKTLSHKKL